MILKSTTQIISFLRKEIDSTLKPLKIFAGHVPMRYEDNGKGKRHAYLDIARWGFFSLQTLEWGAQLLRYALDEGKEGKLIVLVDDVIELHKAVEGNTHSKYRKPRRRARSMSQFPIEYVNILNSYNLGMEHLVTQTNKENTTVLLSEKILKEEAQVHGFDAPDECSLAYKGLLFTQNYFNPETDYVISFMPGQCKGNICNGVLNEDYGVEASHVFFPDVEDLGGLVHTSKGYKKLPASKPLSLGEAFSKGYIIYRKDKY